MNTIAKDILYSILALSIDDYVVIRHLRLVCKRWYHITRSRRFWKDIDNNTNGRIKYNSDIGVIVKDHDSRWSIAFGHYRMYAADYKIFFISNDTKHEMSSPLKYYIAGYELILITDHLGTKILFWLDDQRIIQKMTLDLSDLKNTDVNPARIGGRLVVYSYNDSTLSYAYIDNTGKPGAVTTMCHDHLWYPHMGREGVFWQYRDLTGMRYTGITSPSNYDISGALRVIDETSEYMILRYQDYYCVFDETAGVILSKISIFDDYPFITIALDFMRTWKNKYIHLLTGKTLTELHNGVLIGICTLAYCKGYRFFFRLDR